MKWLSRGTRNNWSNVSCTISSNCLLSTTSSPEAHGKAISDKIARFIWGICRHGFQDVIEIEPWHYTRKYILHWRVRHSLSTKHVDNAGRRVHYTNPKDLDTSCTWWEMHTNPWLLVSGWSPPPRNYSSLIVLMWEMIEKPGGINLSSTLSLDFRVSYGLAITNTTFKK